MSDIVGNLEVTIVFTVPVANLNAFEASSLEEAASNLSKWYSDGSLSPVEDMAFGNPTHTVRVKDA